MIFKLYSPSVLGQWQSKKEVAAMDQIFDRDELHIFITGNEVEKIMFKLFLFVGEACCFVRYSPVPVVWMPIQESLLTLYILLFHYTLRKLWNNFCLNHLNEPFPDIKGFAHLHSMSQETHDQTRPGSLSLSLSLSFLQGTGRRDILGMRLFGKLSLCVEFFHVLISLTHSFMDATETVLISKMAK